MTFYTRHDEPDHEHLLDAYVDGGFVVIDSDLFWIEGMLVVSAANVAWRLRPVAHAGEA